MYMLANLVVIGLTEMISINSYIKFCIYTLEKAELNASVRNQEYTLFYKQRFYKQRQAEIGKKSSKC